MKLLYYYKYISPLIIALLVTVLRMWWISETRTELPGFAFASVFFGVAILVAFLLNRMNKGRFDGTAVFVLKQQGILLVSMFLIMYVLELVLLGLYFVIVNLRDCGLPFCV